MYTYKKDFSDIIDYLQNHHNFLRQGGASAAEENKLKQLSFFLYSIYLYLEYFNKANYNEMNEYIKKMADYAYLGKTYEYHAVNCATLKLEYDYPEPSYYSELTGVHDQLYVYDIFLGLLSVTRNPDALKHILKVFDRETKS